MLAEGEQLQRLHEAQPLAGDELLVLLKALDLLPHVRLLIQLVLHLPPLQHPEQLQSDTWPTIRHNTQEWSLKVCSMQAAGCTKMHKSDMQIRLAIALTGARLLLCPARVCAVGAG